MSAMGGILPLLLLPPSYWPVCIFPILVFFFICRMMKRRLNGYTGDWLRCIISPKRNEFLAGSSDVYLYKISKPMNIYLIRHTSVDVPKGLCYGQSDVPLRPTFEIEAAVTKAKIESIHFDMAYTSPLSRCTRLAQYCGSEMPSATPEYWNLTSEIGKCSIFIKSKTRISNAGTTTT